MSPITKAFLKSAGLFCLFLLLQVLIPVLAWALSQLSLFDGAPFQLAGVASPLKLTIPAMAFSFFVVQLAYVLLLHFTGWARLRLQSGKSAEFGILGMPVLHFVGVFLVISFGMQLLLMPLHLDDGQSTALFAQLTNNVWGLLSVVVVGTLAEELTYRAGILRLTQPYLRRWGAVVLSAVLFAIVHGNLYQAIPAAFLGLVLGYLYLRTDDVRLCWPAHLANNALAVVTLHSPALQTVGEDWALWQQVGLGLLLIVFGLVGLFMRGAVLKRLFAGKMVRH